MRTHMTRILRLMSSHMSTKQAIARGDPALAAHGLVKVGLQALDPLLAEGLAP